MVKRLRFRFKSAEQVGNFVSRSTSPLRTDTFRKHKLCFTEFVRMAKAICDNPQ